MKKTGILIIAGCAVVVIIAAYVAVTRRPAPAEHKPAVGLEQRRPPDESGGGVGEPTRHPPSKPRPSEHRQAQPPSEPVAAQGTRSNLRQTLEGMALPANIRTIVGLGSDKSYNPRNTAVQKLGRNLSETEIKGLYAFLGSHDEDHKGEMELLEFESLRNDILDALLRQTRMPDGLGTLLMDLFHDRTHNEVWRDYCVQHFAPYSQAKWQDPADVVNDPEWTQVTNAYWQATAETANTIAGTALIGMNTLAGRYPGLTIDQVAERSLQLGADDTCGDAARVTALRMCAQLDRKEILPSARILAQAGESIHLRMAAIATLGDLGAESDRELLQSLAAGPEKRLSVVARSAVERLKARLNAAASAPKKE